MPRNDILEMTDLHSSSGASSRQSSDRGAAKYANGSSPGPGSTRRRSVALPAGTSLPPGSMTAAERKLAERGFWRTAGVNTALILSWYLFSISITVYNKWMFTSEEGKGEEEHKKKLVFPFPLFTTCVHMLVQFTLASLVLVFIPKYRPGHESFDPYNPHTPHDQQTIYDPSKPIMTKWFYLSRIGPCGVATGLDIGLGNMSFKFITLTFWTMCKSSVLGFVVLFAFLFGLEKPSFKLLGIIVAMSIGVFLMVAGEVAFNLTGFLLIMTSSASSGFRWSLTQILLLHHPATSNPFSSIRYLAPIMFATLFIIALFVEGIPALLKAFQTLGHEQGYLLATLTLLFPGCLAFCMTSSEFALLQRTSVVTLSICGIFKEVLTISTASVVFGDELTPINSIGLVVTIATIAAYNYIKIKKMREDAGVHVPSHGTGYAPVDTIDEDEERDIGDLDHLDLNGAPKDVPAHSATKSHQRVASLSAGHRAKGLMAKALTVSVGGQVGRPAVDSPTRSSPVKRPEDIE